MAKISIIGLGQMGLPMCRNLLKAGHDVKAFDINPESLLNAANDGAVAAEGIAQAVVDAEFVITMLPIGRHVLEVYQNGVLDNFAPGALLIDCSTIDVNESREAHRLAAKAGALSLDAPVSGGTIGAEQATLTFMVGGSDEAFTMAEPILKDMGKKIVHCGEAGVGQAAKICNNMLAAISMIGAAEAFTLGERLGVSNQVLFDVMSTSSASCWSVNNYCPVPGPVPAAPSNNGFQPGFSTALMTKDLGLAQSAALSSNASTPLGAEATHLYRLFMSQGTGELDFSGIIEFIRGGKEKRDP